MLVVNDQKYLEAVKAFADRRGPEIRKILEDRLSYLDGYAGKERTRCHLFPDGPHSFNFLMERKNETLSTEQGREIYDRWFNGGLTYYGAGDSGVGSPQFSVRLVADKEGWEINT